MMEHFDLHEKHNPCERAPGYTVSIYNSSVVHLSVLVNLHEAMGEPEAIRCHVSDNRVALEPAPRSDDNAYPIPDNRIISGEWLKNELDQVPEAGRYGAFVQGNIAFVNFDQSADTSNISSR